MINQFTTPMTESPITDQTVRAWIQRISCHLTLSRDEKYSLLDGLSFLVINRHEDGLTAKVLNEISAAIDKL